MKWVKGAPTRSARSPPSSVRPAGWRCPRRRVAQRQVAHRREIEELGVRRPRPVELVLRAPQLLVLHLQLDLVDAQLIRRTAAGSTRVTAGAGAGSPAPSSSALRDRSSSPRETRPCSWLSSGHPRPPQSPRAARDDRSTNVSTAPSMTFSVVRYGWMRMRYGMPGLRADLRLARHQCVEHRPDLRDEVMVGVEPRDDVADRAHVRQDQVDDLVDRRGEALDAQLWSTKRVPMPVPASRLFMSLLA